MHQDNHMDSYLWASFSVIAILTILHLLFLNYELPGRFFRVGWHNDIWCIHHDEKILVPDARAFYQGKNSGAHLENYSPPVALAFGAFGPLLLSLSFKFWGMTNKSLRFPALAINFFSQICFVFLVEKLVGPLWGLAALLLWQVNDNTFILQHHFILEHLNTLALLLLWVMFAYNQEWCLNHSILIAFCISGLILVKVNFLVYTQASLTVLFLFSAGINIDTFVEATFGGLTGLLFFEFLHWLFMRKRANYKIRFQNLFEALHIHNGGSHHLLQKHFRPVGISVICRACLIWIDWFFGTSMRTAPDNNIYRILGWLAGPIVIIGLVLETGETKALSISFGIYLLLALFMLSPFAFYMKRLTPLLPIVVLLAIVSLKGWFNLLPQSIVLWAVVGLAAYLVLQIATMKTRWKKRSTKIEENCRRLETILPVGAKVYMHCYAFRFLWMTRNITLFGADDQYENNEMAYQSALRMNANFVVLSAGRTSLTGDAHYPGRQLGIFETGDVESDFPDSYLVIELPSVQQSSSKLPHKYGTQL